MLNREELLKQKSLQIAIKSTIQTFLTACVKLAVQQVTNLLLLLLEMFTLLNMVQYGEIHN